jgi:hypothetical protein
MAHREPCGNDREQTFDVRLHGEVDPSTASNGDPPVGADLRALRLPGDRARSAGRRPGVLDMLTALPVLVSALARTVSDDAAPAWIRP